MYTRRTLWSRPGYVARGLGVPSKSLDLASNRGVVFRPAEPSQTMETPKVPLSDFWLCGTAPIRRDILLKDGPITVFTSSKVRPIKFELLEDCLRIGDGD